VSHHLHLDPDSALELAEDVASFLTTEDQDGNDGKDNEDIREGNGSSSSE
jgi:hypothetical protein